MKEMLANIDKQNKYLIATIGLFCFLIYVFFLFFRPQESWCDDAFWADWARQLAVHNRYYTTVWGFGHPSYCPLYVFLMAGWYKIVGFSFFSAQFPNIFLVLVTYWGLMIFLTERKYIVHWQAVVGFSALYWFTPSMCWIYNCGRIEVLCMLLGFLTIYSFVKAIENDKNKYKIELFIFGLLLFATGVEGVVFATLSILIYSIYNWRHVWTKKIVYLWHFGSYIASLGILGIITWRTHCLHQFFDTMFGFSKTFSSAYLYIRAIVKGAKHGDFAIDSVNYQSIPKPSMLQSIMDGYTMNLEYLILIVIVIILLAIYLWNTIRSKNTNKTVLIIASIAIVTPLVYVLAGRYVSYYAWAAYIPCIIATILLLEQMHVQWLHICLGSLMVIWFLFSPTNRVLKSLDFTHYKDKQNKKDICEAAIDPNVPTVIPYSWYYYVVEDNENIYFQASGLYPNDLGVIIYAPYEYNEEQFMNRYELKERCKIGNKIVYDILSHKNEE